MITFFFFFFLSAWMLYPLGNQDEQNEHETLASGPGLLALCVCVCVCTGYGITTKFMMPLRRRGWAGRLQGKTKRGLNKFHDLMASSTHGFWGMALRI
ncbi:hypothetical protein B0H67DRAFT_383549 [Lasiosphaeris hirsuta]|uniref:Uncharacterized protein n=1 Tax=Lasiosphaeris hirsuta TaxID=260670 RepID=A0AA40DJ14_9PEZI|nr:hypothetical protein B0H67DRAFT_383549 [Lasiosphaeris hirsuta]